MRHAGRLAPLLASLCLLACDGQSLPPHGTAPTGDPCDGPAACAGGLCLQSPFAAGYCSADCSGNACPDGELCRPIGDAVVCLRPCAAKSDCRAGYQCENGACFPACAADSDCPRGTGCAAGECTPLPGNPPGAACAADDECASRDCEPTTRTCRVPCTRDDACPANQTCFPNPVDSDGNGATDALHPICVDRRAGASAPGSPCGKHAECERGACELGRCTLVCAGAGNCGAAETCTGLFAATDEGAAKFRGCLPKQGLIDFNMGVNGDPLLGVPENAVSLSLFVAEKAMNTSYYAGVASLDDAMGSLYNVRTDFYSNPLRYQPSEGTSLIVISSSPNVALRPGTLYTFNPFAQTQSGQNSDYRLRALVKLAEAPPTSGHATLHVFITNLAGGCKVFNAGSAAATLAPWEQKMREIFAGAAITLDEIRYEDVTAPSAIQVKEGAPSPELNNVLKTATQGDTPGNLELVILRRIDAANVQQGFEILGIAGGIPASSGIPGTPHSGAVVSLTSLCADKTQFQFALTAAHELGHTLGLYHNVEQDGRRDQMTDNDADGTSNLMYWAENGGLKQTRISPQQSAALRANPAIR